MLIDLRVSRTLGITCYRLSQYRLRGPNVACQALTGLMYSNWASKAEIKGLSCVWWTVYHHTKDMATRSQRTRPCLDQNRASA